MGGLTFAINPLPNEKAEPPATCDMSGFGCATPVAEVGRVKPRTRGSARLANDQALRSAPTADVERRKKSGI